MNYEAVFHVFLGMIALLGLGLGIVFMICFREGKTIHPIYRSVADSDPNIAGGDDRQPRWTQARTGHNARVAAENLAGFQNGSRTGAADSSRVAKYSNASAARERDKSRSSGR